MTKAELFWDNEIEMEIRKTDLRNYDPQTIQAVRSETARSVKPNVFRDVSEEVQLALWLTDLVELSPEAREILKKLKREENESPGIEWLSLLDELEKFKEKLSKNFSSGKKGNEHLNLISLPVMRPPLEEILPRTGNGKKKKEVSKSQIYSFLEAMIVRSPDEIAKKTIIRELSPLGLHIVQECKVFGVRIIVLGRMEQIGDLRIHGMSLIVKGERTFDGRLASDVRGMYFQDRRLMVIGEEQIGVPGHLTSVHEFAHAYDHTISEKNQRAHYLSTQLWNLFSKSRNAFITAYASTKPSEYFAESTEAYFLSAMRPVLEKNDPQMFAFLNNLFSA